MGDTFDVQTRDQAMTENVINEFLIDCRENLDRLDVELVELEKDPHNAKRLASAFRTIHTIKGGAGFLAFNRLEEITHAGESLLAKMRDGALVLDQDVVSGLLRLVDAVRTILVHVESARAEPDIDVAPVTAALTRLLERQPAPAIEEAERRGADRRSSGDEPRPPVSDNALRVDVGLLDTLMNLVGELVLARNRILQCAPAQQHPSLTSATQQLNLITSELQAGVMKMRMQTIGSIWDKFPRVVRDVATQCGKLVRLELEGRDTELDKTIIEAIRDPLMHLVRNAIDHGIEAPALRVQQGKPSHGTIRMRAYHESGQVNIEMSDDGAGIDPEKIREVATRRGMVTADQASRLTDQEAIRLIFQPGFSTTESVSNLSGRGVGMDVVKTNIEQIGGQVDVRSRLGEGMVLRIRIPLTLAIIPALIVTGADGARYAVPQANLLELVRLDSSSPAIECIKDAAFYRLRGKLLPLVSLQRELAPDASTLAPSDGISIVVVEADGRQFGLIVHAINDTEEIVVKPLSRILKTVTVFAGGTVMGDGTVALILDVLGLAQRARVVSETRDRRASADAAAGASAVVSEPLTLLLFRVGRHGRMAIPLAEVARLEEFAATAVERMGGRDVIQYRGEILPLVRLPSAEAPDANDAAPRQAIILTHGAGHVALVVDEILDIVTEQVELQRRLVRPGFVGSAVIQQRVTEFVDAASIVAAAGRESAVQTAA